MKSDKINKKQISMVITQIFGDYYVCVTVYSIHVVISRLCNKKFRDCMPIHENHKNKLSRQFPAIMWNMMFLYYPFF